MNDQPTENTIAQPPGHQSSPDGQPFSLPRRTMLAGLGATLLLAETIEGLFNRMVQRGLETRQPDPNPEPQNTVDAPQKPAAVRKLAVPLPKRRPKKADKVEQELQRALEKRGLVGSTAIKVWSQQIDDLNLQFDNLNDDALPDK